MDRSEAHPGPDTGEKTTSGEKEEIRGEQGTSSGDPQDDTDPESGT